MPEPEEVFRMSTQKVRPEPGALERQFGKQRRRSTRQRVAVYALVVGLVAGTAIGIASLGREEGRPANPAPLPTSDSAGLGLTAESLEGIWFEDQGTGSWPEPILARFGADGTFALGGVFGTDSWLLGTYDVQGDSIRFSSEGGACGSRDVWTWDVQSLDEGRFESLFRGTEGDSSGLGLLGTCAIPVGDPYNFTRISPTSPAAADITPGSFGIVGGANRITNETTEGDLRGFWLVAGTGHLLRLDGSFYRLDDAGELGTDPDDAGTVEIGRRTLRFISGGDTRGCAEGDVMVWKRVRLEEGRLLGVVTADSCGRDIGEEITLLFLNVDTP